MPPEGNFVIDPPPDTPTWGEEEKAVLGLRPDDDGENADDEEES